MNKLSEIRACFGDGLETSAFQGLRSTSGLQTDVCRSSECLLALDTLQSDFGLLHVSDFLDSGLYPPLPYGVLANAPAYEVSVLFPKGNSRPSKVFVQRELDLDREILLKGLRTIEALEGVLSIYYFDSLDLPHLLKGDTACFVYLDSAVPSSLRSVYQSRSLTELWQNLSLPWLFQVWVCLPHVRPHQQERFIHLLEHSLQSVRLYAREWAETQQVDRNTTEASLLAQTHFHLPQQVLDSSLGKLGRTYSEKRSIDDLLHHASKGLRISRQEAAALLKESSFEDLMLAAKMAETNKKDEFGVRVLLTRRVQCRVQETGRRKERLARLTREIQRSDTELLELVQEVLNEGGNRVELEALYSPELDLQSYQRTISTLTQNKEISLFAFCPEHIIAIARSERLTVYSVLQALYDSGLEGLCAEEWGEMLDGAKGSFLKRCSSDELVHLYESAQAIGLESKAVALFKSESEVGSIFQSLQQYRLLQDSCKAFRYCMLSSQTPLLSPRGTGYPSTLEHFLRVLAVTRLYLDNFDSIAVSVNALGLNIALLSLDYGADSFGEVYINAKSRAELSEAYQESRRSFSQHLQAQAYKMLDVA